MKQLIRILGVCVLGATALAAYSLRGDETAELVKALKASKHTLAEGIKQCSKSPQTALSAKFEFDDKGKLSLSVYAAGKGLEVAPDHNTLEELSGSPEQAAWTPETEVFKDVEHVARSAQQQTLLALTRLSLSDVVADVEKDTKGTVISITPVVEGRKGWFALKVLAGDKVTETKYGLNGDDDDDEKAEGGGKK